MKIEEGYYIRTIRGIIAKIVKRLGKDEVYKNMEHYEIDKLIKNPGNLSDYIIYKDDIVKSSNNIVDLMGLQDLIYVDIDDGYEGGIIIPRIAETQAELDKFKENIKSGWWILKGIVTHEQLENMVYKVE